MSTERKPYGGGTAANRVYEEVELPSSSAQWVPEEGYDTLVVNLNGYRKGNIRIQLTSNRNIRVIGERPSSSLGLVVGKESSKWQRFRKEFPIPLNCDANETTARFEDGILYVKIPKTIAPVETAPNNNNKDQKLSSKPPTETLPPAHSGAESIPKPPPPPPQKAPTTTSSRPAATFAAAQKITNNIAQRTNEPSKEAIDKEKEQTNNASSKANSGSQAQFVNNSTKDTIRADDSKAVETEKEKVSAAVSTDQASTKVNNKSYTTTTTTNEEAQGTSKKITTDGFPAEEKTPATTSQKSSDHEEYSSSSMRRAQAGRGYYRQVIHGMVMELKEPRRLVNMAVAFGFVLLLGLYIKYAFNSIQEFKHQEL